MPFATAGDAGLASPLAAEIEPNDLICLGSVTVGGAAGDVDKTALLSSMDPNCTLLAFVGIGAATDKNDRQRDSLAKWKNAGYKWSWQAPWPMETDRVFLRSGTLMRPREKSRTIEPDSVQRAQEKKIKEDKY